MLLLSGSLCSVASIAFAQRALPGAATAGVKLPTQSTIAPAVPIDPLVAPVLDSQNMLLLNGSLISHPVDFNLVQMKPAGLPASMLSVPAVQTISGSGTSESDGNAAEAITSEEIETAPTAEAMPSSLSDPVLPNVPSSVQKEEVPTPAGDVTPAPIGAADPGQSIPGSADSLAGPAALPSADPADPLAAPQTDATSAPQQEEATAVSQPPKPQAKPGPRLRESFSVLFTEQRPFLLYSQDVSITYLMPNALVDHPKLGRYLRTILENRAVSRWETVRSNSELTSEESGDRPIVTVSGRVEDRFASKDFASMYLNEQASQGDTKETPQILSFNYSYRTQAPFTLRDLFKSNDEKIIAGTVALIATYIQADIVRQKAIRLGTQISPEQDAWLKDLKPSLDLLSTFTLVPSRDPGQIAGLSFHFNPGLLGAEADGPYTVYVPAAIFLGSLSERFADKFSGEALMASRHNAQGFSTASVNIDGLRSNAELGGDMLLEGEVPGNWCDGFHITLFDKANGDIVTEGVVQLLPELPSYGLSDDMLRFRADLAVTGAGGKEGELVFEPYAVTIEDGRVVPRSNSACKQDRSIAKPDPDRDVVSISVTY